MNIVEIVRRMERAGVTIHLCEEKLQVRADKPLTEAQTVFLQEHKEAFIYFLKLMEDPHILAMMLFFDAKVRVISFNETKLI